MQIAMSRGLHRLTLEIDDSRCVGAFLSPGDAVTSTVAMAVPLYILYELSVFLSYFVKRKRDKRAAAQEAADAAEAAVVAGPV